MRSSGFARTSLLAFLTVVVTYAGSIYPALALTPAYPLLDEESEDSAEYIDDDIDGEGTNASQTEGDSLLIDTLDPPPAATDTPSSESTEPTETPGYSAPTEVPNAPASVTPDSGNPNNGTPYTPNSNDPQPDASPSTPPDLSPSVPPSVSPSVSPEPSVPTAETPDQTHSPAPSVSAEPSTSPDSEPTVPQQPTVPTGSTETPSVASTDTVTPNATATDTPHPTLTATYDATATVTVTVSATGTDTPYPTLTAESTPTVRPTRTGRPRRTKTPRPTKTPNKRRTPQATKTPTTQATATTTFTPFPTATATTPPTVTATVTVTVTATETSTFTPTDTDTSTPTATDTPTETPTETPTDTPAVCVDLDAEVKKLQKENKWNAPVTCPKPLADGSNPDGPLNELSYEVRDEYGNVRGGGKEIIAPEQLSCSAESTNNDDPPPPPPPVPDDDDDAPPPPPPPPLPPAAGKQCCFYTYSDLKTGAGAGPGDNHEYNARMFHFGWRTKPAAGGDRVDDLTPDGKRQNYCEVVYHCPMLAKGNYPYTFTTRYCTGFQQWDPTLADGKGDYKPYNTGAIVGEENGRNAVQQTGFKEKCTSTKEVKMTHANEDIGFKMCLDMKNNCDIDRSGGQPVRGQAVGLGCSQAGNVQSLCEQMNKLSELMERDCRSFDKPESFVLTANTVANLVPANEDYGACTWEFPDGWSKGRNFYTLIKFKVFKEGFSVCQRGKDGNWTDVDVCDKRKNPRYKGAGSDRPSYATCGNL